MNGENGWNQFCTSELADNPASIIVLMTV